MGFLTKQAIKTNLDDQLEQELFMKHGKGPMRFGPVHQVGSIQDEMKGLSCDEITSFASLKAQWEMENSKRNFTDFQILRFILFTKFDEYKALNLMKKTKPRHFDLNAFDLSDQLRSKTLFPVPGLKTISGSNVIYMRPSRYSPNETTVEAVIDNLLYVLNNAYINWGSKGIGFIANMNDWSMSNFSTEYCYRFMQCLQGRQFPAKVNLFLIVNPPAWFDKVWKIMKPMLSRSFRAKVFFIEEDEMWTYFDVGYEQYLPDEFIEGKACTEDIVRDYIKFRKHLEIRTKPDLGRRKKLITGNLKRRWFGSFRGLSSP